jgi:putative transposase
LADAYAANAVFDLWVADRRVYGVRTLWHAAKRAGHRWGRDRVARLMRIAGIDGVVRGRRTIKTTERDDNVPARHPDLIGRAWSTPTRARISGGWPILRIVGHCRGSATPRSAWMCSPAVFSGGG